MRAILYRLARLLGDGKATQSPDKLGKRIVNKAIGRYIVRRLWLR